jgi:uncharacterized protein
MFWNNRNISERKERVRLLGGQEQLSLLHISDIHLWYATTILETLTTLVAKHNPDIIMLTGDYYDLPRGAHNFRKFLLQVAQKHLVLFVRGNHDTMYGSRVSNLLFGIPNCLCVEDTVYKFHSKRGHVYNITSWKNKNQLPEHPNEVNIVLIHNPEKIKRNALAPIDLILAGHLHGGQFIFFKTKDRSHFPASLLYRHCTDRKQIGTTTVIISRGLGDTFPFRLNCPKEVVQITIE